MSRARSFGERIDRGIIVLCAVFSAAIILGLLPFAIQRYGTEPGNARYFMGLFLIGLWVLVGGLLMRRNQDRICALIRRWEARPKTAFVTCGILLACVEEGIACMATNLGGVFGDPTGQVYITASANFLDLVLFHSVIVILPLLVIWAHLLERYRYTATRFFILFGVQGALAEVAFAGMEPALFPTWLLVYGLMVWLPCKAFTPAFDRQHARKEPGVLAPVVSLVVVQLGGAAFTLAFIGMSHSWLGHPLTHFPPR